MVLDSFGRLLKREFPENRLENARASSTSELDNEHRAAFALSDDENFWQAALDDETPELIVDFGKETAFDSVILQENIATGQRGAIVGNASENIPSSAINAFVG